MVIGEAVVPAIKCTPEGTVELVKIVTPLQSIVEWLGEKFFQGTAQARDGFSLIGFVDEPIDWGFRGFLLLLPEPWVILGIPLKPTGTTQRLHGLFPVFCPSPGLPEPCT